MAVRVDLEFMDATALHLVLAVSDVTELWMLSAFAKSICRSATRRSWECYAPTSSNERSRPLWIWNQGVLSPEELDGLLEGVFLESGVPWEWGNWNHPDFWELMKMDISDLL